MDDDLTPSDLKRIEHLLKRRLAWRMAWIQRDRALNHTSRNVGNARKYVETAQTLRRVLNMKSRQSIVPLREMHNGSEGVPDQTAQLAGIEESDTLAEVVEKVHELRNPNVPVGTMTDHSSVPGQPSEREADA